MTVGMIMAAIAFVCAALVQIQIDVSRKQIFFFMFSSDIRSKINLFQTYN